MNSELSNVYQKIGSTICLLPFFNAFVKESAAGHSIQPCCMWTGDPHFSTSGRIGQDLNSDLMRDTRRLHAENRGDQVDGCFKCYQTEKQGYVSERLKANQTVSEYLSDTNDKLQEIIQNDFHVNRLFGLDYFPSRYCNLACITCFSEASTTREKLETRINLRDMVSDSSSYEDLHEILSTASYIALTGGESLDQPRVLQVIDQCISSGIAADLGLYIVTNLTRYNPYVYRKIEQFGKPRMTFSIDGTDSVFEYQRMGADWQQCERNFSRIVANHPQIAWTINYVVTAVSAVGIPAFLQWAYLNNIQDVIFTPVHGKDYLEIHALPPESAKKTLDRFNLVIESFETKADLADFANVITTARSFLDSYQYNAEMSDKFVRRMILEDIHRPDKYKLYDVIPELKKEYQDAQQHISS